MSLAVVRVNRNQFLQGCSFCVSFSSFISFCQFIAQGFGALRSRLATSLLEHGSMGQAIHPLTL